jgi:hypothetical protein
MSTGNTFSSDYGFNIGIPNASTFKIEGKNIKKSTGTPKMITGKDLRSGS